MDKQVRTREELEKTLKRVSFAPSCVDFQWSWETREALIEGGMRGWLVRTSFTRPDTMTGDVGRGFGRWEFVEEGTSESGVLKTCWLLVELIVRHELMEGFLVDDVRIFNPHHTVEELSIPTKHPGIVSWAERVKKLTRELVNDPDVQTCVGTKSAFGRLVEAIKTL